MTEEEFKKKLVELQTEEVHWKRMIFYPNLLPSDRDEINNIVRKWEKLVDVVCLWDFKIRKLLNMIGEVTWGESEFTPTKTIDMKKLQKVFLTKSVNVSQIVLRWKVGKICKFGFFRKTPIFNVELWVGCSSLDTDEEPILQFLPTNTQKRIDLIGVGELREILIDMYEQRPEYSSILGELVGLYNTKQIDLYYKG